MVCYRGLWISAKTVVVFLSDRKRPVLFESAKYGGQRPSAKAKLHFVQISISNETGHMYMVGIVFRIKQAILNSMVFSVYRLKKTPKLGRLHNNGHQPLP